MISVDEAGVDAHVFIISVAGGKELLMSEVMVSGRDAPRQQKDDR